MADPLRALVSEAYPHARITGNSARCNDILGLQPGQSLYINLVDGSWHDKNTGDRGRDIRSLFVARKDLEKYFSQIEQAMAWIAAGGGALAPVVPLRGKDVLVGDTRMPTQVKHPVHGVARPEDCYWYRSQVGTYLGCAARFIDKNGKKIVPSYVSVSRKGSPSTWHWTGFGGSGPLYNGMELLNPENSHVRVIVVEGEKTAEALVGADSAIVTTWAGGTDNVRNVSWFELRGRDVTLCPDYDNAGVSAMEVIGNILRAEGCRVRIVPGEAVASALGVNSPPKGWDVADVIAEPEVIARAILDEAEKGGDVDEAPPFFTNTKGETKPSAANALLAIEGATELGIVFNDDVKLVGYRTAPPWRGGGEGFDPMRDEDVIRLMYYLKHKHGVDFPRQGVLEGLLATAAKSSFSPWTDWLDGLKWDGEPRIDNVFGAIGCTVPEGGDEGRYMRFCSQYIFTGVVSRLYRPGIQMDMMPVLEGRQGIGKSRFIKTLAGMFTPGVDHSSYVSLDLGLLAGNGFGQKDAQMMISGSVFVEVEELSQIDNTDVNTVKRIVSVQSDKFRPPYGATMKEYWRRCMLIGTTNRTDYLRDDTGNRRFLPVSLNCVDAEMDMVWLLDNREQLFAEAVCRFREYAAPGKKLKDLLDLPDSLRDYHSQVTNDRFIDEPWADVLRDYFTSTEVKLDKEGRIPASVILLAVFDIKPAFQTTRVFKQLTTAMRIIGATHERVRQPDGSRRSMYKIPPKDKLGESPVETAARELVTGGTEFSPFTSGGGDVSDAFDGDERP